MKTTDILLSQRDPFGNWRDVFKPNWENITKLTYTNHYFKEYDGSYLIEIIAPGTKKEDVAVDFTSGQLKVKIKRNKEFCQKFNLPDVFEEIFYLAKEIKNVEANLKDGILSLRAVKSESKKIPIEFL